MTELNLIGYGAGKLIAYTVVSHVGWHWMAGHRASLLAPLALGLLRGAMGLLFGVGIFLASAWLVMRTSTDLGGQVVAYLLVYVPTRWIEWSLLAMVFLPAARSWRGYWCGTSARDRWWRVLGIVVSCAADVPVLLAADGLPVGRFMC